MAWLAMHWYLIPVLALLVGVLGAFGVMRLQKVVNREAMGVERAERVLRTGQPAVAMVLDTRDMGTRVERIYILTQLRLQVQPEGLVPAFEAEIVAPISPVKLAEFAPGRSVKLRVDPATREIAIDQPLR